MDNESAAIIQNDMQIGLPFFLAFEQFRAMEKVGNP